MPLITNLKNKLNEKQKISTSKKVGIVLLIIATIGYVGLFVKAIPFFHNFLLGTFGLFGYALFLLMYIIGGGLVSGARYVYSKKYIVYLCLALLSVLSIFHIAFTWNIELTSYGTYLSQIYTSGVSVGGLLLGLIIYPLQKFLFPLGAIFLFLIALAVSIWLIYDYLTRVRYIKKADTNIFVQKVEQDRQKPTSIISFETKRENTKIGIDAEIEEEQKRREETLRKLGLEPKVKDRRFVDGKTLSDFATNTINSEPKKQKVEQPTNFKGTFGYIDTNLPKAKKQQSNNDKNIEFLGATLGGKNFISQKVNGQENVSSSNEQKPREFTTRDFLNINFTSSQDAKREYEKQSKEHTLENTYASDYNNINTEAQASGVDYNTPQQPQENTFQSSGEDNQVKNEQIKNEQTTFDNNIYDNVKTKEQIEQENKTENPNPIDDENIDLKNFVLPEGLKLKGNTRRGFLKQTSEGQGSLFNGKLDENPQPEKKTHIFKKYVHPTLDLLKTVSSDASTYNEKCEENARALEYTLESFSIPAKVVNTIVGPAVTRYELEMPVGIPINKIFSIQSDLTAAVAAKNTVMIQAPIPGKSLVGIEVPNQNVATVGIKEIIDSSEFLSNKNTLSFAVGKDVAGKCIVADMHKMPHMLVAGTTGSGKSVALNSLIISMLYKYGPEDLRLIIVDPKFVEFSAYSGIPHLLIPEAIIEPKKALNALDWAIGEMERRYLLLREHGVKEIMEYNDLPEVKNNQCEKLYHIVIVVDEVGDLMINPSVRKELEEKITKLTQKSRAIGINLILATQRPSVDVITGLIKSNLPSRMAFAVNSYQDSRTILEAAGAENLLGRGDMLFSQSGAQPVRIQGCFVSNQEINNVVRFIKENNESYFDEDIEKAINKDNDDNGSDLSGGGDDAKTESGDGFDPLMVKCLKLVIKAGCASTSMLQRKFAIGNPKAARIIDQMEEAKFIGPMNGAKPRPVYITPEQFFERFGETIDD